MGRWSEQGGRRPAVKGRHVWAEVKGACLLVTPQLPGATGQHVQDGTWPCVYKRSSKLLTLLRAIRRQTPRGGAKTPWPSPFPHAITCPSPAHYAPGWSRRAA